MEKNYELTWEKAYMKVVIRNTCSFDDIINSVVESVTGPYFYDGMPSIYDLSNADISGFDSDMVIELSEKVADIIESIGSSKIAIVTEKEINLTLIQLFKEVYQGSRNEFEVFESFDDARDWILS